MWKCDVRGKEICSSVPGREFERPIEHPNGDTRVVSWIVEISSERSELEIQI